MFRSDDNIGPYTLIKKIGHGGFGEVWLAEKRSGFASIKVVVRLPRAEQFDRGAISQEAALWEQASGHTNILPVIEADEYNGQLVIVSEYAPDGSLEQKLKTHGKLPIEKAVEMTIQILDGLEFLHSRNIIHRDLKPANILFQGDTPRLADFGLSRAIRSTITTSQNHDISGSLVYMSPEALDGKRSVQTDIWAVGATFYQLLTGKVPFPQSETLPLLSAILMREVELLPDFVPRELKEIVAKALQKLPEDRYQTAGEMRDDLRRFLREAPPLPKSYCRFCSAPIKPDFVFCVGCGKPVDKACPQCGDLGSPTDAFCRRCGNSMRAQIASPQSYASYPDLLPTASVGRASPPMAGNIARDDPPEERKTDSISNLVKKVRKFFGK